MSIRDHTLYVLNIFQYSNVKANSESKSAGVFLQFHYHATKRKEPDSYERKLKSMSVKICCKCNNSSQ